MNSLFLRPLLTGLLIAGAVPPAQALPPPKEALPADTKDWPENWRLHADFPTPAGGTLNWENGLSLPLPGTAADVAIEHPADSAPVLRIWSDAKLIRGPEELPALSAAARDFPDATVNLGADFTALATFTATGDGTLFSKCAPEGEWSPDARALFIRDGRLVYDIGWLGFLSGGPPVAEGRSHSTVLRLENGTARLWVDGQVVAEKKRFTRPEAPGHVLKAGKAAPDFAGRLQGSIGEIRIWQRALNDAEVRAVSTGPAGANTPDFHWHPPAHRKPVLKDAAGAVVPGAWVQPLERSDHAGIVSAWNDTSLAEGKTIYTQLCIVCHGTKDQPGSLPTALRFTEGAFKNGADPFSQYQTLTKGFGQMVPQPQYTTQQKYAVIQYIRETFLRPHNPSQLTELTPAYLNSLPRGLTRAEAEREDRSPPPYVQMELGPVLFWTLQAAEDNIIQKGITIRVDEGPGGVTKGRAWMVYEHDTMRLAAATAGDFVDWQGIAFDGSHNTHTSLTGEKIVVTPPGPAWAHPDTGSWDDPRVKGRDGKPTGPLPAAWMHYRGTWLHGDRAVLSYTVGDTDILESPSFVPYGNNPVFIRTLNTGPVKKALTLRLARTDSGLHPRLFGEGGKLEAAGDWWLLHIPPGEARRRFRLYLTRLDEASLGGLLSLDTAPMSLASLTRGGPSRWPETLTTSIQPGAENGPFAADVLALPEANPWKAWLRPGGFDFTPDGTGAVVAMWNGDVWKVDGLTATGGRGTLTWRRMAAGLFQPLGVKFRNGELFIACRDQIACLKDVNGDGETDFIGNFNNDHQVTEHFHEFAMGLQTDAAGNFYYAKSARHALKAVVPHHGTLLRVSADGSHTDILATGFRAANGVCLNADGSFFVTDQEGHWTPKNRINRVTPGGFYGNLFGYTGVTDPADSAMQPPMVWITNDKDRSPAELLWVPKNTWGPLAGTLLNLSYGTGEIFAVPHEEVDGVWQGAVCELPLPGFPSGIMRGRFGPDGALYACGMFAWAGNATAPGGFYRIRSTGRPAHVPVAVHARTGGMEIVLSDALRADSLHAEMKVWSLQRSANYGSPHLNTHPLPVERVTSPDGRAIFVSIPSLEPTDCYELKLSGQDATGTAVTRALHGTIHRLK